MRALSEHDVRGLLDMESCIEAMSEVLASLARGELYNPLRSIARASMSRCGFPAFSAMRFRRRSICSTAPRAPSPTWTSRSI